MLAHARSGLATVQLAALDAKDLAKEVRHQVSSKSFLLL
jgi:hypothetical protein